MMDRLRESSAPDETPTAEECTMVILVDLYNFMHAVTNTLLNARGQKVIYALLSGMSLRWCVPADRASEVIERLLKGDSLQHGELVATFVLHERDSPLWHVHAELTIPEPY